MDSDNFFVKTFIKNPKGLIVLGILVTVIIGPSMISGTGGSSAGFVIGIIITIIGILWLVMRNRSGRSAIAANLPLYLEITETLKKSGYDVDEFEHKSNLIRSNVCLNGNRLGEVFLVAPPPSGVYAQFKRIEDAKENRFERTYIKEFGKHPAMSSSYWPDNSLIGAFIAEENGHYPEKGEWLTNMANIFQG
jgi:hypothetical protein